MAIGVPSESPAIVVKEVDLSGGVPNVQSTTGAFAGQFRWGPAEQATLVDNEATLASTFGAPTDSFAVDFLTAASFLRYSSALQVSRAVASTTYNAMDSAARSAIDSDRQWWIDNVQISDSDMPASYTRGLTTVYTQNAFQYKNKDALDNATFQTSYGGVQQTIFAKYPGAIGNSLQVQVGDSASYASAEWKAANATFIAQFDDEPTGNERHVLVIDEDGLITGTAGTVLERYPFVSGQAGATNADGSSNYDKDVINRASNYIYLANSFNGDYDSADNLMKFSLRAGSEDSGVDKTDIQNALDVFEDKDTIQVDFLIAPGMIDADGQQTVVNDMVATAAETRKDCVVVTSPAKNSVVGNSDPVKATVTEAGGYTYSSYLFVDNNHLKVYDKYNDKYVNIPAAGATAGIMAASDANAAPWFSPAGNRRGSYLGVTSLAYTPTKSQRDTLYKAGINPIANLPGQGILLYGDKTHMNRPSAFDRVNVRRLFNVVERAIALAARNTLFELNDEFTRAEFVNIVEPFLREIKGRRGITDFRVVCDETNNTPAIIDRNEFVANIFIKPARSINYITLNFVAVRSGVDFEEVAGLQV